MSAGKPFLSSNTPRALCDASAETAADIRHDDDRVSVEDSLTDDDYDDVVVVVVVELLVSKQRVNSAPPSDFG